MPTSLKQIETQALALSATDRARLAKSLLDSLRRPSHPRPKGLTDRMHAHITAVERGEPSAYPDEDVFGNIRKLSR